MSRTRGHVGRPYGACKIDLKKELRSKMRAHNRMLIRKIFAGCDYDQLTIKSRKTEFSNWWNWD